MKITLKKIKKENINIMQSELLLFIRFKVDNINHCNDYQNYCNDIIVIDVLQSMFYIFRDKIESLKHTSNIILSPSQAVILLYCATWDRKERTQEERIVMQMVCDMLHEKLINI